MDMSDFKEIPGYLGYYVNSAGTMVLKKCREDLYFELDGAPWRKYSGRSAKMLDEGKYAAFGGFVWRVLSLVDNHLGYMYAKLVPSSPGLPRSQGVHRLVYMAHVGEIPQDKEINHIDHNRGNNRLENLELVTHQENVLASMRHHGKSERRCESCGIGRSITTRVRLIDGSARCFSCTPPKSRKEIGGKSKGRPRHSIRKVVWPSSDELEALMIDMSLEAIGRQYGVSGNAVKKWAKSYGIYRPGKASRPA